MVDIVLLVLSKGVDSLNERNLCESCDPRSVEEDFYFVLLRVPKRMSIHAIGKKRIFVTPAVMSMRRRVCIDHIALQIVLSALRSNSETRPLVVVPIYDKDGYKECIS